MLGELEEGFSIVENKILQLAKDYKNLSGRWEELNRDHSELQEKYNEERRKNQAMAEEQKNIKMQSAIAGNPDHNRLMKNHINRLVKEIDLCIAELQNKGL